MMEVIEQKLYLVAMIAIQLVAIKAFAVGSDFNFRLWFKHKKKYWNWYSKRETFDEFLSKETSHADILCDLLNKAKDKGVH